jgi:benzoyl-CoA reductase/2-hydroxyglutaryl-CoA dehydratase subunit BcrC/BadD/HgdB
MTNSPGSISRGTYALRQKKEHDRRCLAVLPIYYPKELLTAFDILAVELWGPPGPPCGDGAGRLQSYVCSVVRNALAFLQSGQADAMDGALFPHTCDSLQGMATLVTDFGGWSKKSFVFQHPRGSDRESAKVCVEQELRSLAGELEAWTGKPLDLKRLQWALDLHREIDACRATLLDQRARCPLNDVELYELLRRGEWLWPEEHLEELRRAVQALASSPIQKGIPIMVTGYVPEPEGILAALGNAGAYVAGDDYAAVGRRVSRSAKHLKGDPWAELVERYGSVAPCPTRNAESGMRMQYLKSLCKSSGACGVLVHVQKFCEPELFDIPDIRKTFAAIGVPVLVVEGDLEQTLSGQTETRLEAFVEMLSTAGRPS